MGRGPKPQPPGPGASTENWDEYYRYLRIWEDAGKKRGRRIREAGAAAGIITSVYTSGGLPQQGATPLRDEGKTLAQGERATRARSQRKETGYQGRQRGGSGSQK